MNIKILVATMSMEIGGAETHILELCKALQRKGLRVYVASNGGAYEPELAECGIIHHKVPLHNKQPFNIFAAYRTLKRIIVQNDIRLVHAHARIPAFLCGFLQRKLNFRFVTTAHWVFDTKFPYNLISNWGEKTLAVSEDIKEYLTAHYNVPKNDIFATINGIDTEKFSGSTEPAIAVENVEKSRQSRKNCRIMSISRLDKDRSLAAHLLIEIAPVLAKKFSETIIYIVGGGNDFENVRVKAEKANAEIGREVVVMAGPQVAANRWLASCDVFVGASRAALEAMAVGKPIIASGNEGYMGLLTSENLDAAAATNFCYRDCQMATSEKMLTDLAAVLAFSDEKKAELGRIGREYVLTNYSVDRMADDAVSIYRQVLETPCPVRLRRTDILISGYYGYNNSGDDLLLKSIITDLRARQADLTITVLSMRPKETRKEYGVNAIYRFNFLHILLLLRRTKLLVTGGGSVIQDLTSTQSLIYYLWIIKRASRIGVKNMLYANGIGPIRNAANIKRMQVALNNVDLITLREEASHKLLLENHVTKPKIVVTADPAFSLPPPSRDNSLNELAELGLEPQRFFCVAVRFWRYNPEGFEENLAKFADYAVEKYGLECLFVPMRPSDDTEISRKIISLMKKKAYFLENPKNMDSIRGIVALSSFTVAMRLHTLIYAINQNVPIIGLAYDPKVKWLMETVGQPFYVDVEDLAEDSEILRGFSDRIFSERDRIVGEIGQAARLSKGLAERNVDLLLELLREI